MYNLQQKPKVGDFVELFRFDVLTTFRVQQWIKNRCFMTDGTYFKWNDCLGFVSH